MSSLLHLCRRAAMMHAAPVEGASVTATLSATQELSHFLASLSTLAAVPGTLASSQGAIVHAASDCARQLLCHVSSLPTTADVSEKVMSSIFVMAKQHQHFLDADTTYDVVRETSLRFGTVNLLLWKPKQLLAGLHAIAKSCAARPPLPITADLVANVERALPQLNARDTALFLWCLAALQWFDQKPGLWDTTCRRCILLLNQMNHVSRTTVLHAVLLTPTQCDGRAQQELMGLLQQDHEQQLHQPGAGGMSAPDNADGESDGNAGDHKGLRLRLLSSVARLPTDVQLTLLERLCHAIATAKNDATQPMVRSADLEELAYLFEHLSRKHLSGAQSLVILETVVEASAAASLSTVSSVPGARKLWRHAITTVAGIGVRDGQATSGAVSATRHTTSAMPSPPAETTRDLELLVSSGLRIPFLFSFADSTCVVADDRAPLLNVEETKLFVEAVAARLLTQVTYWQRDLSPASARSVWTAAVALDFLAAVRAATGSHASQTATEAATRFVNLFPVLWAQRDAVVREGVELIILAQETPCAPAWAAVPPRIGAAAATACRGLLSRTTAALLTCADRDTAKAAVGIGVRRVLELCIAVEGTELSKWATPETDALKSLWPQLLSAQRTHTPLLRVITELVHMRTCGSRVGACRVGGSAGCGHAVIPDALLEVWIRHLLGEGASPLTRMQEEALLGCFAQRAADPDALERAFLLLVTRRLGESQTLLDTRALSPSAVVCLVEHAGTLAKRHPVTASTILFMLMQRLSTEVRTGVTSLDALNDVASLLSSAACEDKETRDGLSIAVKQGAVKLLTGRPWPAESKAFLVAYLVRAEVQLDEPFLAALRTFPSSV